MTLIKVKTSKQPGQVWLIFADNSYLPYSADDWVRLRLILPVDLNPEQFQQLVDTSLTYRLKIYALNQIALSPKIRRDLLSKLKLKARFITQKYKIASPHTDSIVTNVLDYLDEHDLIDEQAYVDHIIGKYSHKPQAYITRYLSSKGLGHYPIKKDDTELLKNILAKQKYQQLASADYKTRTKLITSLIHKGFAYDDIKAFIDSEGSL